MNNYIKYLDNKKFKIIFILILILISIYRSPFLFLEGRFIAEEATVFFKYGFFNEWYKTLFFIDNIAGYYYLTANINAIFANLLPLDKAPLATTYGSLIILFSIFLIILNTNSFLLKTSLDKYLACLVILLSPPFVTEVWLNSVNIQVYLGILTILILFINFEKNINFRKYASMALVINGLSGLYSCVVTPFFLLKYFIFKKKNDLNNFIILFLCCLIQGSIVIYSKLSNLIYPGAIKLFQLNELINFFYNAIAKSILGREITIKIFNSLDEKNIIILSALFFILTTVIIIYLYKKNLLVFDFVFVFLLMLFASMAIFVMVGGVGNTVGGRYSVINGCILIFTLINLKNLFKHIWLKNIMYFFLLLNFTIGIQEFIPQKIYDKKLILCIDCPIWKNEIKKWQINNDHKIKIWPYTSQKWWLDLKNPQLHTLKEYINL